MEVAKRQKSTLWMLVISLVASFIPFATIVTGCIQVYFIYKLAVALRSSTAWVYTILVFIPLVGLIALLVINGKATKKLQEHGIRVGLMGARMADFNKIPQSTQDAAPNDKDRGPSTVSGAV